MAYVLRFVWYEMYISSKLYNLITAKYMIQIMSDIMKFDESRKFRCKLIFFQVMNFKLQPRNKQMKERYTDTRQCQQEKVIS